MSSSIKLPGPFVADKLMSPDAVTVPVNVGAVKVLLVSVFVPEIVSIVTPSIDTTPAETLAKVVSVA